MSTPGHTTKLIQCLDRLQNGDPTARDELIEHACERLRYRARQMLSEYQRVRRWAETDDLLQSSLMRLHRALAEIHPEDPRQFYALAVTQIRRELIDLARHFYGAKGCGANHHTDDGAILEARPGEFTKPENLEEWTRFHEAVSRLPEKQREAIDMFFYKGMTKPEIASVLGQSLSTVKRHLQDAKLTLKQQFNHQDFE